MMRKMTPLFGCTLTIVMLGAMWTSSNVHAEAEPAEGALNDAGNTTDPITVAPNLGDEIWAPKPSD